MFLIISHSLVAPHFLPHLFVSLQVTASRDLHFLFEEFLNNRLLTLFQFLLQGSNLSVVIDHNPGVDIEDDHCDDRKDCKPMGHVPIDNKPVKWSLPLFITC